MTQKELAAALHVSDRAVSQMGARRRDSRTSPCWSHWRTLWGSGVLDTAAGRGDSAGCRSRRSGRPLPLLARQARERTRRRWGQECWAARCCLADGGLCPLRDSGPRPGRSCRPVSLDGAGRRLQPRTGEPAGRDHRRNGGGACRFWETSAFEGPLRYPRPWRATCREGVPCATSGGMPWMSTGAQDILYYRSGE